MSTSGSGTDAPSLFFGDARECKAWLNALPVSSPVQGMSALLDALRVFNRAPVDPLERLKCLELVRDRSAFMLNELRTRHFSKSLPLAPGDAAAWNSALAVLEEMESGYRKCLSESALAEHEALVTQRIARALGAQMLLHSIVYRPIDAALWSRLNQLYAAAEKSGHATEKVKDSLESESGSSVMEAYARAVLLQAAGLSEMTPAQVAFAEAVLRQFMRKVEVLDHAPEGTGAICPLVVDLSQARGAEPTPRDALGTNHRVIDADGVARSLRRRLRALQGGEELASLGLPAEVSAVDPHQSLARLGKRWGEPAARAPAANAPTSPTAGLVHGLADIHFFLAGGKAFEQPGKERELSREEKEDIAVFGRVTERTQSIMASAARTQVGYAATPRTFSVEPWDVIDESIDGVRLRRRASATRSVAVGRLVALRLGDAAPFMVGVVRALSNEPEGLVMSVSTFPGKAEPVAARGTSATWSQALLLPAIEKIGVPRTLIVSNGMAMRGRPIHYWKGGAQQAKVAEVLERGADFDRASLD